MTHNRGNAFLLKISDGHGAYATIAGLRTEKLSINGEAVPAPKNGNGWRELAGGAGTRAMDISATGIFTGSTAEKQVRENALDGKLDDYELSFESGEQLRGRFLITRLEYQGDFNGERNYLLALSSSGEVRAA